jgi:hypothetical protein
VTNAGPGRRVSRRAILLAALGLAAASAPQALATEGVVDVAVTSIPESTELATAIVDDAAVLEIPPVGVVVAPTDLPATTAQPVAEEPASTGAVAAPPPEPVADSAPVAAPEEPEPPEPQPDAPPVEPAAPVQQSPTNVNVSVRIDSPGDDGAVTQVNVAADVAPPQYQPEPRRYQPVLPLADESSDPPTAEDAGPEPEQQPADSWDWTWNWSCGDAPVGDIAVPFGIDTSDWNWNWNWVCGDEESPAADNTDETTSGYQTTPAQYRPVNVNVSIRINSPGQNGPVVQTNVAVAVAAPAPVAVSLPDLVESPVATIPAPTLSPLEAAPALVAATIELIAPGDVDAAIAVEEDDHCCVIARPRGVELAAAAPEPVSVVLAGRATRATRDIAAAGPDIVAVAARVELRAGRAAAAQRAAAARAAPARPQVRPARTSRGRLPADITGRPVAQGGFGLMPLDEPQRTLPYVALMLLAFAFAYANVSWAAARNRPTPDAADDEPPDRPG